ncbi:ABC transporter substrate-binding protein [Aquidulcibacter paucihalophilus]|uniref:ABC transporter substrate-binding protein n=1 Tax=Aquidulcibacter paucihalophilus TaxID=1978549 RepID=UPI000A194626|nr:ABC transporter substrate-binding protein [Aquidulcibacter paucihalophilus]
MHLPLNFPSRRTILIGFTAIAVTSCSKPNPSAGALPGTWEEIMAAARGQTVRWNAWAGDPKINAYITWVAEILRSRFDIRLEHLKTDNTASGVTRLIADKTAKRTSEGSIDLMWINGENFAVAKQQGLLFGPFTDRLPNFKLVDTIGKPSTILDFTLPTLGFESPWGMAQITFFYDQARLPNPPRSLEALLAFATKRPGRFTYPAPGDFVGVTFLKQILSELCADKDALKRQVNPTEFPAMTAPLWDYLERLHPNLWRAAQAFPPDYPALMRLLEDQEVDLALAFNPAEGTTGVTAGRLPPTTRAYTLDNGTITNSHFVAIPFNSSAREGALVTANFLLSPEAQARKADPKVWGDPGVLELSRLTPKDRTLFDAILDHPSMPRPEDQARALPEPHPSWHLALSEAWRARFAA